MSENTFFCNKKTWVLCPKFACEYLFLFSNSRGNRMYRLNEIVGWASLITKSHHLMTMF